MMEVAGMGMGSKTHQTTHRIATAPVQLALDSHPNEFIAIATASASTGPPNNAHWRVREMVMTLRGSMRSSQTRL
jgi:hypothetical protein